MLDMTQMGDAVRRCRGELSQVAVAERIGDMALTQPALSDLEKGKRPPSLAQVAALEMACDRPRGFILRAAGLVDDVVTVETAIQVDPLLTDRDRDVLLVLYRQLIGSDA
jgi:transcriptional regulator with XRE-family HTH domain